MKIAIFGFGSVGKGLAKTIAEKGLGLTVTAVCDSKTGIIDNNGIDLNKLLIDKKQTGRCGTPDITPEYVLENAEFDTLVELTPTNADTGLPALNYITAALKKGKNVVTSNKGPIALKYSELKKLADENGCIIKYEATVCGAIPVINALEHGLAGNRILKIYGVFNGTCNYILTRMSDERLTYNQALAEARELGYAEADPTYDIKGIDAAIKLVILANTVLGFNKTLADVDITGIDNVPSDAIALAEEEGKTIRLIGEIDAASGELRVSPRILPKNHILVVKDTLNAVTVKTDCAGAVTFIGKGAGSIETASAVISDLLYIRDFNGRSN